MVGDDQATPNTPQAAPPDHPFDFSDIGGSYRGKTTPAAPSMGGSGGSWSGSSGSWEPETFGEKATRVAKEVVHRAVEPLTQGETEKIPGLQPDVVTDLASQGRDTLGSIFGKEKADYLREKVLRGFTPEVTARAAAKTLGDWESPAMKAVSLPGEIAHSYLAASKAAEAAGNTAVAISLANKAKLAGAMGTVTGIKFASDRVHDLIDNWGTMSPAERWAGIAGAVGGGTLAGVGASAHKEHFAKTGQTFMESLKEEFPQMMSAKTPVGREAEAGRIPVGLNADEVAAMGGTTLKHADIPDTEKEIIHVTPKDFLDKVGRGKISPEVVQNYRGRIKTGEDVGPSRIMYDTQGNIIGADGRHRAAAHEQESTERIPVEVHRQIPPVVKSSAVLEPEKTPVLIRDPLVNTRRTVETAGGTFRGMNSAGLVEITLPRSMTDKLPLQDRFKDFVSVTMPQNEITPGAVHFAMLEKYRQMGGK